jgi:hypothetical protein
MDHRFRRAALALVFPVALAATLGGFGCSSDNTVKPPTELAPPTAVAAVDGDGFVTISWTASPDQSRSDFTGYNIYRWTSSLADTAGANLETYRVGTASASVSSFVDDFNSTLSNGENGVRYYYHVRSKGDGLSVASNQVQAAGRPEGTGEVIEELAGHLASGFHFATGDSISLRVNNPDRFDLTDMYLGTTDAHNDIGSPLAVKSPSTLDYADPQWSSIVTSILDLGSQPDANTAWKVQTAAEPSADLQEVTLDHVYVFKTTSGNYAKIQVTGISGDAGSRIITFRYAYQPTSGLYLF